MLRPYGLNPNTRSCGVFSLSVFAQDLKRSTIVENFVYFVLKFCFNRMDELSRDFWNISAFWNISSNVFVHILDGSFLPRMIWVTEIYVDPEKFLQFCMFLKQNIVVCGDGFQFRKSLLYAEKCFLHFRYRYRQYLLKIWHPRFPVRDIENHSFSTFAWNQKVSFGVTNSLSFVDIHGSFVDEDSIFEFLWQWSFESSSLLFLLSPHFDSPAIWTFDVPVYAVFRDLRQIFFVFPQSSGNVWWWFSFVQKFIDFLLQILIGDHFHSLILWIFSSDVCFMISFEWIVYTSHRTEPDFFGDSWIASVQCFSDCSLRIFLLQQNFDFKPFAFGKMFSFSRIFFIQKLYKCSDSNGKFGISKYERWWLNWVLSKK